MSIISILKDRIKGKAPKGAKRSKDWRDVRFDYLTKNPQCVVCGGRKKVEVHHKIPFHIAPDLELDTTNLIALCERKKYGINCHLLIGHLGNYQRFNDDVEIDTITWAMKIRVYNGK